MKRIINIFIVGLLIALSTGVALAATSTFDFFQLSTINPDLSHGWGEHTYNYYGHDNHVMAIGYNINEQGSVNNFDHPALSLNIEGEYQTPNNGPMYSEWHIHWRDMLFPDGNGGTMYKTIKPLTGIIDMATGKASTGIFGEFNVRSSDGAHRIKVTDAAPGSFGSIKVGSPNNPTGIQYDDCTNAQMQVVTPAGALLYAEPFRVFCGGEVVLAPQLSVNNGQANMQIRIGSSKPSIANEEELLEWMEIIGMINYTGN